MQSSMMMKWGRRLLAVLVLIALIFVILAKIHVHRIYGGLVEHADPTPFRTTATRTAITHVSVLAPDGNSWLAEQTVIVEDGVIRSIEPAGATPPAATTLDGRGRFLIPGLIDAHVHLRRQPNDLLLYLANGVTRVRDLSGSPTDLELRREIRNGRPGPHLVVASPALFSSSYLRGLVQENVGSRMNAGAPDNAGALVSRLQADGYDAIKTYADLGLDTFVAVTRRAREAGLHTVGHLPDGFDLDDLATTDLREIAHAEEIVKALMREAGIAAYADMTPAFVDFVQQRSARIVDDLLARDIAVNSTMWFMEAVGRQAFNLPDQLRSLPLEYANPGMVQGSPYVKFGWLPGRNKFEITGDVSDARRAAIEQFWAVRAQAHRVLMRAMVARGVLITAGTDATTELVMPGFSMHDELVSLTHCGMSNAQALRAATANAAAVMGTHAGTIEVGAPADLVLLRADPLADIRHTRTVESVFAGGKHYDRQALDGMLEAVAAAHAHSRKFDLQTLAMPD